MVKGNWSLGEWGFGYLWGPRLFHDSISWVCSGKRAWLLSSYKMGYAKKHTLSSSTVSTLYIFYFHHCTQMSWRKICILYFFYKKKFLKNKLSDPRNIPNSQVLRGTLIERKKYCAKIRKDIFVTFATFFSKI